MTVSRKTTAYQRTFEVFATFTEGMTVHDLEALMEQHNDKKAASKRLSQFVKEGLAVKLPRAGRVSLYIPTGKGIADRKLETRDPARGRKRLPEQRLTDLERELARLKAFEERALKRHPDLATPDHIHAARERVCAILDRNGRTEAAKLTLAGMRDDSNEMLVAIEMAGPAQGCVA